MIITLVKRLWLLVVKFKHFHLYNTSTTHFKVKSQESKENNVQGQQCYLTWWCNNALITCLCIFIISDILHQVPLSALILSRISFLSVRSALRAISSWAIWSLSCCSFVFHFCSWLTSKALFAKQRQQMHLRLYQILQLNLKRGAFKYWERRTISHLVTSLSQFSLSRSLSFCRSTTCSFSWVVERLLVTCPVLLQHVWTLPITLVIYSTYCKYEQACGQILHAEENSGD